MLSRIIKVVTVLGLVVIISPYSTAWSQDKGATQVAVYNADQDGGESLGEEGVLKCLQSEPNLKPEFITDLSCTNLSKYKVLVLPLVRKFGNKAKAVDWRWEVTNFVYKGGRILLTSDNTGIKGEVPDTLFPTIMEGSKTVGNRTVRPIPAYSINKGIDPFRISYSMQIELRRGSRGVVFLRNDRWCNVGIVGDFGKGKVAALGFPLGVASRNREITPAGQEARILLNVVRWLAGEERYEVPNVWLEARKLPPLNKGPSRILDLGEESGPHRLKAGAASVDITPPNPVGKAPLAGLGRGRLKCKGVHDPIMLRALVLDNGKTKIAFVTMDRIVAFGKGRSDKIRRLLKEKIGIPESNVLINCTHTHSGAYSAGLDLTEKTVEAVCKANSRLQEARLGVGSKMIYGICGNLRKRWHDDYMGLWGENLPNPDGIMDNECGVVRVEGKDRKLIAVVVNYRGTPSAGGGTPYISGDYAGIAMHDLEKRLGCVALFTQGFQGNVFTCAFRRERTLKEAKRLGKKLADEVAAIIPHIDVKSRIRLAGARKHILLPRRKRAGYLAETQSLLIGESLFVLGEPEIYVQIGMRIKQILSKRYSHVFCCGVGRGCGRYLTWRRGFGSEHWEVDARQYGYTMDAEDVLVKSILGLTAEVEKAGRDK